MTEFDEIRPYEPEEMKQAFNALLRDRHFNAVMKGLVPWLPKFVRNMALRLAFIGVKTPLDFQMRFMKPLVKYIIDKHTDGVDLYDGSLIEKEEEELDEDIRLEDIDVEKVIREGLTNSPKPNYDVERYTFLSNHRDIVLDSAFLDVLLIQFGYPTTVEIGIGDNLLIYPWIKHLVRMNKAFTVRRGLTPKEMLSSSQLMSRYIHYAVTQKRENIWLAQREGRAKDSDDRTQEAVLKMLAMGGDLKELNIIPLTISYEYDPCDYLKAKEFQLKRDNPAYKKSKQDDLENMKTGILGYKGRVTYRTGTPVNKWIGELEGLPRNEFYAQLASRIDLEIHAGYDLWPGNFVAQDELNGTEDWTNFYSKEEKKVFDDYLKSRLDKIDLPEKDVPFLRKKMLEMYANPVKNYYATGVEEP